MLGLLKILSFICLKPTVHGLENFPRKGPALVVINHLGDADSALLASALPFAPDVLGKIELYSLPILGKLMTSYGIIWLHRGRPDRRALRAALEGLAEGRIIIMAPEGRYSLIGGLEPGGNGAAFLALKADVPIVPVALTGTENAHVYRHLRRLRRAPVTLTVGVPFRLANQADRQVALREGMHHTMRALACLLPVEYRGVYR
ncbi:MAG: lysophospholipid acyltransferase family protein, partial [Gammaproteobacteria bacterium]